MNLEGQNLESLRRMIRHLQEENKELKELLKKSHISFNDSKEEMTTESIDEDAYIKDVYISDKLAAYFLTLFQGRRDVYALRGAKGGYFPQCFNRWKDHCPKQNKKKMSCQECPYREWKKLDREVGKRHLLGYKDNCTDVIGLYPLLEDDTCKLLVFDFDNHDEDNYDYRTQDIDKNKCISEFDKCYNKEKALVEWIKVNEIKVLNSGIKIA